MTQRQVWAIIVIVALFGGAYLFGIEDAMKLIGFGADIAEQVERAGEVQ